MAGSWLYLLEEHPAQHLRLLPAILRPEPRPGSKVVQDGAALRQHASVVEHQRRYLADRIDGAEVRTRGVAGELADLDAPVWDAEVRQQQAHLVDVAGAEEAVERQHHRKDLASRRRPVNAIIRHWRNFALHAMKARSPRHSESHGRVRTRHKMAPVSPAEATAELIAVIVAVTDGEPRVLTIDDGRALPSGPFELTHRSLQSGCAPGWSGRPIIRWAMSSSSTPSPTGTGRAGQRMVAISYLGLAREARGSGEPGVGWQSWYRYFPWEDHRIGSPRSRNRSGRSCGPGPTVRRTRDPA